MKNLMAFLLAVCCAIGLSGCKKTEYSVTIADNYPIANTLENTYQSGEQVTIKLETVTEHYYVLKVNGVEQDMDREASDLVYTYFTFPMPNEDVVVQIEDRGVEIPPAPETPVSGVITLTIAETEYGCFAFEYLLPNDPYCFYAFDEEGDLYQVLWPHWDGLKEKDRVVVEYNKLETLTYDEYPDGGWNPQYKLTATGVNTANCISNEQGSYQLTLPKSGETIKLRTREIPFAAYITDELVAEAERKIEEQISPFGGSSGFYLQISEGDLCLVQEVIHYLDEPKESAGCFDHEHLFFSERITLSPINTETSG